MDQQTAATNGAWFLKTKFPAFWPASDSLTLPEDEFHSYLGRLIEGTTGHNISIKLDGGSTAADDSKTGFTGSEPTREVIEGKDGSFMNGLLSYGEIGANQMLTDNGDLAYRSTGDPLVDLFSELEDLVPGGPLSELLNKAWAHDPLATLKIIFNARSIHLGKASRSVFYRCAGWLAQHHPLTLVSNLRWLSRPVIEKKAKKSGDETVNGMVMIPSENDNDDITRFDVRHGVAHGYWKDLLNILALSVGDNLTVLTNVDEALKVERQFKGDHDYDGGKSEAKEKREELRGSRHDTAITAWDQRPLHRALHMMVARVFAQQLLADLALLRGSDEKAKQQISLCAKWAPSQERFHDKHTFIISSIAEIMYPVASLTTVELPKTGDERADREIYLRHAREAYRKDISALRKHMHIVERDLSAKTYSNIKYEQVPSIAMNNYRSIFAEKDTDRFEAYLDKVADGSVTISGATLLPSAMVLAARVADHRKDVRKREIQSKVIDGQWRTLVQRLRDSGTLESCIAVCDVSGSMSSPIFPDGTRPIDSALGLSLLVAEVTAPPFGGAFITFSNTPTVERVNLEEPFYKKISVMAKADWGMSTDFVAVFQDLILPMAVENRLTQDQMVKRVIVFSDMQFNSALPTQGPSWSSSFKRIQKRFREAGYEMPQLVFWNLAGGRPGYSGDPHADAVAPKPVVSTQEGTAIVSGYSQGMLKVFLEKGVYEDTEEAVKVEVSEGEGDEGFALVSRSKKQKMDPSGVVQKAVGHKAYDMLKVVD